MRRTIAATAVIGAVAAAGLLIKHDHDQQHRLDELSARVASLSAVAQALTPPLQALPLLLSERRCALDPRDIERIIRAASGAKPGGVTPTVASAEDARERPERPPLSTEQAAALDHAKARLQEAIARHALTRDDVLEMRAQLATVGSTQESEALRSRIATAINHQELKPQDRLFIMP